MSLHRFAAWILQTCCLTSFAAMAQPLPEDLKADQIRSLIAGKTLAMRFAGTPISNSNFFGHWDFKEDGSLCGRLIGSDPGTECADIGKWQLQDNTLCWQFQRIGTTTGINSVCGWIRKAQGNLYEVVDTTGKTGSTLFSINK
jgi:hypothetical protein